MPLYSLRQPSFGSGCQPSLPIFFTLSMMIFVMMYLGEESFCRLDCVYFMTRQIRRSYEALLKAEDIRGDDVAVYVSIR